MLQLAKFVQAVAKLRSIKVELRDLVLPLRVKLAREVRVVLADLVDDRDQAVSLVYIEGLLVEAATELRLFRPIWSSLPFVQCTLPEGWILFINACSFTDLLFDSRQIRSGKWCQRELLDGVELLLALLVVARLVGELGAGLGLKVMLAQWQLIAGLAITPLHFHFFQELVALIAALEKVV